LVHIRVQQQKLQYDSLKIHALGANATTHELHHRS